MMVLLTGCLLRRAPKIGLADAASLCLIHAQEVSRQPYRIVEQPHFRRLFPDTSPGTTAPAAVVPQKTPQQPHAVEYLLGLVGIESDAN